MLWHIVKRELFEQVNSLRFALAMLLIVFLMLVNAVGHIDEYKTRQAEYGQQVSAYSARLEGNSNNLYKLVLNGPGELHKKPSPLSFCAHGSENNLPKFASGGRAGWGIGSVSGIWRLKYSGFPSIKAKDIFPVFLKIDWILIISNVLSFLALVFTFDAISGEVEHGTLRLTLSNSIARRTVLTGKFLSCLMSLGAVFMSGVLVNLLLLYLSGTLQLNAQEWSRIGGVFVVGLIYIAVFIALGFLISTLANNASTSLVILLLIWVIWVILVPSMLGTIMSGLNQPSIRRGPSPVYFSRSGLRERYIARGLEDAAPTRKRPPTPATLLWAEFLNEEAREGARLHRAYLNAQVNQIQIAREVNRISPTAIAQYAVESLAGTGFQRHLNFLKNAERYAEEFNDFLISADRADPDSLHVPFVREGMSDKPVSFESIPKFQDRVRLGDAFKGAMLDVTLLLLFFTVLFAAAHVSFQRKEI
ncbi:MAG: ABC transporter permease subunit [Candidatus Poribacteria bacterium]|nr:ABC transporter permease subunit [Candidatus Poribacteria bacterium]